MTENETLKKQCPLCESESIISFFIVPDSGNVVYTCVDCSHMFLDLQPGGVVIFENNSSYGADKRAPMIEAELARHIKDGRRVAEIGAPLLSGLGYELTRMSGADVLSPACNAEYNNAFDVCVLNSVLDQVSDPVRVLQNTYRHLKRGGTLLFFLRISDSLEGRKHDRKRAEFYSCGLQFFSRATIENVLCKCGFERIRIKNTGGSGVLVSCRAGDLRDERVISIIIPVYNEESTVSEILDGILAMRLEGLRKEVIVVESNSTDSTRQIVEKYARERPGIKLILEDKPQGKGHAVRAGFCEATGDFIAIQDGDLEYDLNDYDQLVAPLICYQKAFVLGSRHMESWKIRSFGERGRLRAIYMNFGHILFSGLINIGCGTRLKDPFTMYKLFRRECLYGLEFEGNRFELDWEIVIKLVRKGYVPVEIPVSYQSRGFSEGKKVSLFVDPLIWIVSFIKYRFVTKIPGNDD